MTGRAAWLWPPAIALAIALATILVLLTSGMAGLPGLLEGGLLDLRFRLRAARPADARIAVIAIDDASIDRIGRWPWSRVVLARALDTLHAAGPALIAVDILLSETEAPAPDQDLARAIAADGPVLLPFVLLPRTSQPDPPPPPAWVTRFEYGRVAGDARLVPAGAGLHLPVQLLGAAAAGLGDVSLAPDATGAFRSESPVVRVGDALYPSFDLEAVRILRNVARQAVVVAPGEAISFPGLALRTDAQTRLILDTDPASRFEVHSFADLLDGRLPPAALAGRLVLIGATATGLGDRMATPFDPALPGVLRHAGAISGMLDGRVVRRDDVILGFDVMLVLAGCLAVGIAGRRALRPGLVLAAMLLILLPALDVLLFDLWGWWLDATLPFAAVSLTAAALLVLHLRRRAADVAALRLATQSDLLTGLANRAGVHGWRDTAGMGRLLICAGDLDGFKQVNDTLGHPAGDALLREVSRRLRRALRPGDLAARLGGDEFLLLLRAPDDAAAVAVVREAFRLVSAPYTLDGAPAAVGISLGIAAWPDDDPSWETVMARADAALYAAKRAGKRRIFRAAGADGAVPL